MEIRKADLSLVRAGFALLTAALVTGFAVPAFLNARMAVAGHVGAILNALLLVVLGVTWGLFAFGPRQSRLTRFAFIYNAYASLGVSLLAAAWGTSRNTPIAAGEFSAAPWRPSCR